MATGPLHHEAVKPGEHLLEVRSECNRVCAGAVGFIEYRQLERRWCRRLGAAVARDAGDQGRRYREGENGGAMPHWCEWTGIGKT